MEEDKKMSLEDAISYAVNSSGFSLRQLQFGYQGVIPVIMEGNLASI